MSIRSRSVWGAILLFGGLLILVGAGVYKSSDRIRYDREVERKKPDPEPPSRTGPNILMILGGVASAGGLALVGWAARDMVAEIGQAGSKAEDALQRELIQKRDPKPKP
jgi:drug/metabolite transporter (DMT)-like permease